MFRKMPFILLAIILLMIPLNGIMPLYYKSILYALSLSVKSAIICILPFLIFMLMFKTLSKLASKATKLIVLVLAAVCVSNFFSTMLSYSIGSIIYGMDLSIDLPKDLIELQPAWVLTLPKFIANDHAMFAGIILGIGISLISSSKAARISDYFEKVVNVILRVITCVIPLFIAGFIIKLIHDQVLKNIIQDYALIFGLIATAQFCYIACIYMIVNNFKIKYFIESIKNMLPAAITGFGTMSSAAAMPLTILGTEKNSGNSSLPSLVIPSTVNIHLIGDCFAIPIFAFAVMKNFCVPEPAFISYLFFALFFVLAKFSVAAIPGGGIIVMLPILEGYLGFTPEMSSLITALYILFDPVITCANVSGNGAFALGLSRVKFFRNSMC